MYLQSFEISTQAPFFVLFGERSIHFRIPSSWYLRHGDLSGLQGSVKLKLFGRCDPVCSFRIARSEFS